MNTDQNEDTDAQSSSAEAESYTERIKVAYIPQREIVPLFSSDTKLIGLPDDAQLVYAHWNARRGAFNLLVRSEKFDPVPEGEKYPELTLEVRSV